MYLDGQHIHVGPEHDNGWAAGAKRGDDTGARDQVAEPDTQGVQLVAGEARVGGELHVEVALQLARLTPQLLPLGLLQLQRHGRIRR